MKLDKKKMMIIGGVLLAVGIGVYFWRKRNAESDDLDDVLIDDDAETEATSKSTTESPIIPAIKPIKLLPLVGGKKIVKSSLPSCPPNSVAMGYLQRAKGSLTLAIHIAGADRPKVRGLIRTGNIVKISGTSFDKTYRVSKTWTDKNGNIGAIYIVLPPPVYESTPEADRTFENIGCITKIKSGFFGR